MKRILLASVAVVVSSGAALADNPFSNGRHQGNYFSNGTGTTAVNLDVSRTKTTTHTVVNRDQWDNYSGIGTYSSAEHGGISDIKTTGKAGAATLGVNFSTANAVGVERSADLSAELSGYINPLGSAGIGLDANLSSRKLEANTSSVSGSGIVAGASLGGSVKAESAGYAAGSAAAYKEWGNSYQNIHQEQWQNQTRWQGSGSVSRTR
ncbi:hypothetical protein [Microvirga guangxiensis]|nr:hypothetical protein [Microvirga guangxiensis]